VQGRDGLSVTLPCRHGRWRPDQPADATTSAAQPVPSPEETAPAGERHLPSWQVFGETVTVVGSEPNSAKKS